MRSRWYDKTLFFGAAVFNLSAAAVLLVRPEVVLATLGIKDAAAKLPVRSLASSVTAWGVAYALVLIRPAQFRSFVGLGIFSKTLFFMIYAVAYWQGRLPFPAFVPALIDLLLAGLFAEYLVRTARQPASSGDEKARL